MAHGRTANSFRAYFAPARPTKSVWEKRVALKFEVEGGTIACRPLSRHAASPVDASVEPDWRVDFHAREDDGEPVISAMVVASPVELLMALGFALAGFSAQTELPVATLVKGLTAAAETARKGFVAADGCAK